MNSRAVSAYALITIAIVLLFISSTLRTMKNAVVEKIVVSKQSVVEVIQKVSTYSPHGIAMNGFLIKSGDKFDFVQFDEGSLFEKMETPKVLLVTETAGLKSYTPLVASN